MTTPGLVFTRVATLLSEICSAVLEAWVTFANPKSSTFTRPRGVIMTLAD
jgi:hypothetical protein